MAFGEEALKYLNLGIESEIAAYVFYKRAMKMIGDRSECWAPYKDILSKDGLPDIDELVQETHKELLGKIRKLKAKKDILEMALLLEREAFDLYRNASSRTKEPEAKKIFDYLSSFETGHVQSIEKELAAL
jgi:rubrerythrin